MRDLRSAIVGGVLVLVGVGLGAILFGSGPADAQASGYRTCAFGRQESHDIDGEGRRDRQERNFAGDRIIHIPTGWEVAGAGGAPNGGYVLICRR